MNIQTIDERKVRKYVREHIDLKNVLSIFEISRRLHWNMKVGYESDRPINFDSLYNDGMMSVNEYYAIIHTTYGHLPLPLLPMGLATKLNTSDWEGERYDCEEKEHLRRCDKAICEGDCSFFMERENDSEDEEGIECSVGKVTAFSYTLGDCIHVSVRECDHDIVKDVFASLEFTFSPRTGRLSLTKVTEAT